MYDDYTDSLLDKYAREYGLPLELVRSVAAQESGGKQSAVSPAGAIGVMQLMPGTAKELGVDPYDAEQNIEGGTRYLRDLYKKYEGNLDNVLGGYNAGPGAVDSWGGIPPYKETQGYVAGVRAKMNQRQANAKIVASEPLEEEQPPDNSTAKIVASEPLEEEAAPQQPARPTAIPPGTPQAYQQVPGMEQLGELPQPGMVRVVPHKHRPTALDIDTGSGVRQVSPSPGQQYFEDIEAGKVKAPPHFGEPESDVVLDVTRGAIRAGKGVGQIYQAMPLVPPGGLPPGMTPKQTDADLAKQGLTNVLGGAMEAAAPVAIPAGLAASPWKTLFSLGLGWAGSEAGQKAAEKLGASPTDQALTSVLSGLLFGAVPGAGAVEDFIKTGELKVGDTTVKVGKFAEGKPLPEMTDAELIFEANKVEKERPGNYKARAKQIVDEVFRRQAARGMQPGEEAKPGAAEGTKPRSPFEDVMTKEPQEDHRPSDAELAQEPGQPQQPKAPSEDAKIVASEPLPVEDVGDPIQWVRGQIAAGADVSVSQIQRQFKMGYGKATGVLREAMAEPDTMGQQPHEQPAGQEPELQPVGQEQSELQPEVRPDTPGLPGVSDVGGGAQEEGAVVPPAVPPVPGAPSPEGYRGTPEAVIHVPHTDISFPARYRVVEAGSLTPSHDPINFQAKPQYLYKNERDYTKQENQFRILEQVRRFAPEYLVNNNPDAVNGPPMVDDQFHAFGGNSRLMTIQRIYQLHPDKAAAYRDYLTHQAPIYGIDRAELARMKEPVLVRELNEPGDAQRIISEMNKTGTAALSPSERALSDSKRISTDTLDYIHHIMEQMGGEGTLNKAVSGPAGPELIQRLISDGVITIGERPEYLTAQDVLTPEGKTRLGRLMVGRFFSSVPQYEHMPPVIRAKLERVAAPLARVEGRPDWDNLNAPVREGLDILHEARVHGLTKFEDLNAQQGLQSDVKYSPQGMAWAHALKDNSAKTLAAAVNRYLELERPSRPGSDQDMFAPPPVAQPDAFREAFAQVEAGRAPRPAPKKGKARPLGKPINLVEAYDRAAAATPPAQPLEARRRNIDQGSMFGQQGMELEAPREPEVAPPPAPPGPKSHKLAGAEQESFFTPAEEDASKAVEKSRQAKLLGEQLTEQMRSGQAARPANLKPAETRDLFADEGPEQEGLFSRPRGGGGQGSLFGDDTPEHWKPGEPKPLAPAGQQMGLFDEKPGQAPPPPRSFKLPTTHEAHLLENPNVWQLLPGRERGSFDSYDQSVGAAQMVPVEIGGAIRYPALKINSHAMWLFGQMFKQQNYDRTSLGFQLPGRNMDWMVGKFNIASLDKHVAGYANAAAGLRKLTDILQAEMGRLGPGRSLVIYQGGERMRDHPITEVVYEELDHALQTMSTGSDYAGHVDHVTFLGSPLGRNAVAELGKVGYDTSGDPDPVKLGQKRGVLALEVGVRLMRAGRWKEIAQTPEEAIQLAQHYVDLLIDKHGDKAMWIVERVYDAFGDALEKHPAYTAWEARRAAGQAQANPLTRGPPPGYARRIQPIAPRNLRSTPNRGEAGAGAEAEVLASRAPKEEPDEFIEKPPASGSEIEEIAKGNPTGGPDDGPLLGAGLGSLHPYVMKGIKAAGKYWSKQLAEKLEKDQKRQTLKPRLEAGKLTPQEIYKGLDVQRGYTSERDLWHTAAIQQAEDARRHLGQGGANKKLESDALTIYRDFKSRPGQLAQWINGTHPNLPGNSGWPHDPVQRAAMQKNLDHAQKWIKDNKELLDLAQNPTPGMKKADAALTHLAGMTLQEGQTQQMLSSTIKPENYAPHNYHEDDPSRPLFDDAPSQKGNIKQHFEYGEERQHPTILDGVAHGLLPRSLNAVDNFIVHGDKFATARATRMFIRSLVRQSKLGVWAMGPKGAPQDWVQLGPDTSVFRYTTPNGRTVRLYVPRWVEKAMEPVTQPNPLRKNAAINWARRFQARNKQMALSLSMFHFYAMQLEAINSMPDLSNPLKSYGDTLKQMAKGTFSSGWKNDADFQAAERDLVHHGGTSSIQGHMIDAYQALQPHELPSLWDTKVWSQPVLNLIPKTAKKLTEYTFGQVQRFYKVTDYGRKVEGWKADHPNYAQAELKQAKQSYATYVNNVYGGLHWENQGINKIVKEILSAVLLAPDWQGANVGQVLQTMQQSGKSWHEGFQKGKRGAYWKGQFTGGTSPGGQSMRAYWLKAGLFAFASAQAASIMASGKRNPDPLHHPFDVYMGKEINGTDKWATMTLRGAGYDLYRLMRDMIEKDVLTAGGQFLRAKSSPGERELLQLTSGRDAFGQPLANPKLSRIGRNLQGASKVLPGFGGIPFNLTNLYTMVMNNRDPERKREYTAGEIMLNLIGVSPPYRRTAPQGMRLNRQGEMEEIPEEPSHGTLLDQIKEAGGKRYKEE